MMAMDKHILQRTDSEFVKEMKKELIYLYQEKQFSDYTITTSDGVKFKVHKLVMSAFIPYLKGTLQCGMIECTENNSIIEDITSDRLEPILDYVYKGELGISIDKLQQIYIDAQFFCFEELCRKCTHVLIIQIDSTNVVELLTFAQTNMNDDLKVECLKYINDNAITLVADESLLHLNEVQFKSIVSKRNFDLLENDLLGFALKWLSFDSKNRLNCLDFIVSSIKFEQIPQETMRKEVLSNEILRSNKMFMVKMLDLMQNILSGDKTATKPPQTAHAAIAGDGKEKLVMVGNAKIFHYDIVTGISKETAVTSPTINSATTIFNRNSLIITGAEDSNICALYSPMSGIFSKLTPMNEERAWHRVIQCRNKIYACGGYDNNGSVEVFDAETNVWLNAPKMQQCEVFFGLSEMDGALYAVGGRSLKNLTSIFERFDPRENIWTPLNFFDLTKKSMFTRSITRNNLIYTFTAEMGKIYDVRNNKWLDVEIKMPPFLIGKYFSMCKLNNEIYMTDRRNTVENERFKIFKYDWNFKDWTTNTNFWSSSKPVQVPENVFDLVPMIF